MDRENGGTNEPAQRRYGLSAVRNAKFSECPAEFVMNDLTLEPMLFLLRVLASSGRVHAFSSRDSHVGARKDA